MITDNELISGIKEAFGTASYFDDQTLNRKYIAGVVFNNDEQLARLNRLVHPAVFRAFDAWSKKFSHVPYVLKEAALLFESDSYQMCDHTVMIQAPLELRIKRVMKRDGLSREEVVRRDAYQFPEEKKALLAEYIISNDDTELVIPQVLKLHELWNC